MNEQRLQQTNARLDCIDSLLNQQTPLCYQGGMHVGIDLGTADIQTVVVDDNGYPIAAFLDWADVVRDGIVVDYFGACQIVRQQLDKVEARLGVRPTHAITSYPPGTDPQISINVVESAGIEVSQVIDEPSSVAAMLEIHQGAVVDVGGGTTGTAIIKDGQLQTSLDEPSGGRHVSLTIAGGLGISYEDAEQKKRQGDQTIAPLAKPVIEKMADIVANHINGHQPAAIYLTGGGTLVAGFEAVFQQQFPQIPVVPFSKALYLTPLAIASYGLNGARHD
ncbi:ethanolamine utilization protein EutJ [Ferrimonas lipolytica]|uniref:Ethanolamine utilization protein EutJ n=1 Tax=Ferrimonas lipolytica TaxID=2724191 RepID=A0A6H1UA47_9GAMM|nr:ethanolamine utilization protein EutJ [Ferrimonas lipolytica]QIZ75698.1 ethanolamine utilization protein EutJ [Ferrimonas lipolytica]